MIRLIAMDMDGTLLFHPDPAWPRIPPENATMLRECAARGIHLALASGRLPDDAGFFAIDEGLPMHIIGLNGSILLDRPGAEPLFERCLPEATARGVLSVLLEYGLDVSVFSAWGAANVQERSLQWAELVLGSWFRREGGRLRFQNGMEAVSALLPCAGKIVAITEQDREGLAAAKARIHAAFPDLTITSSWWNNFEINPPRTDKGTALAALADHLHIPMSQVMAIGDNDNDVPMLRAAGLGVAMGNATDAAKAAAGHITLTNTENGVAAAIRKFVLE